MKGQKCDNCNSIINKYIKKIKDYLFIFRERGREGEREGEKPQCLVAPDTPPPGGLAHNPGMCPAWESNQQPFGSQASTQSPEPHQPGLFRQFYKIRKRKKMTHNSSILRYYNCLTIPVLFTIFFI